MTLKGSQSAASTGWNHPSDGRPKSTTTLPNWSHHRPVVVVVVSFRRLVVSSPLPGFLSWDQLTPAHLIRMLLLIAGIEPNPGPTGICTVCRKAITKRQASVRCSLCNEWCHNHRVNSCSGLTKISDWTPAFICRPCKPSPPTPPTPPPQPTPPTHIPPDTSALRIL